MTLMIAPEDTTVTRNQLSSFATPAPTRSWQPVPFADFIDYMQDISEARGLIWGEEQHVVCRNDTQLFSMIEVRQEHAPTDGKSLVCFRTSVNKSLAPGGCFGKSLTVCTNLDLWGDTNFSRRQTTFVQRDLKFLAGQFLDQFASVQNDREAIQRRYASALLTDQLANHTMIRLVQAGVVSTRKLDAVLTEFYEPSHVEHLTDGLRTANTLFNAVTESALKQTAMDSMVRRTTLLHEYVGKIATHVIDKGSVVATQLPSAGGTPIISAA